MASELTRQQLAGFRQLLKQRYYALREEVRQELINTDNQHFVDFAERVHDLEDASVADLLVDLQLADIDRHIQEIRDVDAALIRIAEGNYGICSDCSDDIPVARLTAYPTANRCLRCQTLYEKNHAHPSYSTL